MFAPRPLSGWVWAAYSWRRTQISQLTGCKTRNIEIFLSFFCSFFFILYRKIPKISPRAYIFQRPFLRGLFLEGVIFGGANKRREVCVSKSARLQTWREMCVSKSIGLAYSWKEIYVSNSQKVFPETRLEDVDLSKTWPYKYFVHMDRENQGQAWRGTTQTAINCDTFWL